MYIALSLTHVIVKRGIRRIGNAFIIIIQTGKAALPPNAEANSSFSVTYFPPSVSRQLAFLWLPTENIRTIQLSTVTVPCRSLSKMA